MSSPSASGVGVLRADHHVPRDLRGRRGGDQLRGRPVVDRPLALRPAAGPRARRRRRWRPSPRRPGPSRPRRPPRGRLRPARHRFRGRPPSDRDCGSAPALRDRPRSAAGRGAARSCRALLLSQPAWGASLRGRAEDARRALLAAEVTGGHGSDRLLGDGGANILYGGLAGNDIGRGYGGDDTLSVRRSFGGGGDDIMRRLGHRLRRWRRPCSAPAVPSARPLRRGVRARALVLLQRDPAAARGTEAQVRPHVPGAELPAGS